jgi:hypothetical protein
VSVIVYSLTSASPGTTCSLTPSFSRICLATSLPALSFNTASIVGHLLGSPT